MSKRKRDHYRKLHRQRRKPAPVLPILAFVVALTGAALYAHRDSAPASTTSLAVATDDAIIAQLTTRDAIFNAILLAESSSQTPKPASIAKTAAPATKPAAPQGARKITGELKSGESLTTALGRLGVSVSVATAPIQALEGAIDFRRSKPGDKFEVDLTADGKVQRLRFGAGGEAWEARATADGFARQRVSL